MSGGGQGALFSLSSLNFQYQVRIVRLRPPRRLPAGPASLEPGGSVEGYCRYFHEMCLRSQGLDLLGAWAGGGHVGAAAAQAAGPQLGAEGGGGGVPSSSPFAVMVSPMQFAIVAGAAEADAKSRLVHAVWAAEQQPSDDEVRGRACSIVLLALSEFQVSGQ